MVSEKISRFGSVIKKIVLLVLFATAVFAGKPDLMLLKEYEDQNVTGWLMSEKLDGVRAYWDGKKLISRGGLELNAPAWFTENFPPFELDGELWSKRGDFERIVSIVKKKEPHDGWKDLTYNIFDVPSANGGLMQRLSKLEYYLKLNQIEYISIIKQLTCKDETHLKSFLKEVEKMGGEGIVVRNPESKYATKRDSNVLKVKSFYDAECEVIAHNLGDGKNKNLLGSLTCKDEKGMTFDVGSGFSDAQRKNPPSLGEKITYKYQEITKGGKPRFPVFLRIKEEI